jgi:tetratricopeptide (TPR) repeat protein
VLAGLLAQSSPGRADPPAAAAASDAKTAANLAPKVDLEGPEAEAKDRARVLFQQGVAAYRAGRYYEAVDIFLETQRIYPDTQLSFNVARAYENLGNGSAALRYYRDYLRQADRPSDGDEVRARARKLEQQLAERGLQQLTVLSQPEAATVVLDGKPVGVTPWTGETYPGKHRLLVALSNYTGQEQVVDVYPHTSRDVSVILLPEPERKPLAPAPIAAAVERPRGISLETLLTVGTGLALLGSAVVSEAATKEPGMSSPTAFLAGSGLGLTGVGSVMLYFDLAPRSKRGDVAPPRAKDSASAQ